LDQPAKRFAPSPAWDTEDSLDLYQVTAWGKPYFGINEAGHVVVRPDGTP
jgi:arginine decarboxylase